MKKRSYRAQKGRNTEGWFRRMVCFTYGGSPFRHPPYGTETAAIHRFGPVMSL